MNINDSVNTVHTVLLIGKIKTYVEKGMYLFALKIILLKIVKESFLRYVHLEECGPFFSKGNSRR